MRVRSCLTALGGNVICDYSRLIARCSLPNIPAVSPVPSCPLLTDGSELATVHLTFTNNIDVNILATAKAQVKEGPS